MRILCILVNYRSDSQTLGLVRNLAECRQADSLEVLVVDNSESPSPGFPSAVEEAFSQARVLKPEGNLGYFGAARRALKEYRLDRAMPDWVMVSNVDLRLAEPEFFAGLEGLGGRESAVVGPAIWSEKLGRSTNPQYETRPSAAKMRFLARVFSNRLTMNLYFLGAYVKYRLRRRSAGICPLSGPLGADRGKKCERSEHRRGFSKPNFAHATTPPAVEGGPRPIPDKVSEWDRSAAQGTSRKGDSPEGGAAQKASPWSSRRAGTTRGKKCEPKRTQMRVPGVTSSPAVEGAPRPIPDKASERDPSAAPAVEGCLGETATPSAVYSLHGSCLLFSRTYFEAGGDMEHPCFLFGEEIYVAETARRLGLGVLYHPGMKVLHEDHATTGLFRFGPVARWHAESAAYLAREFFGDRP